MRRAILCSFLLMSPPISSTISGEIIDDAPLSTNEVFKEVSIVGYRQFPKDALTLVDPKTNKWVIDASLLYEAAAGDANLQNAAGITSEQIRSLPLKTLTTLYKKTPPSKYALCTTATDKRCSWHGIGDVNVISLSDTTRLNGQLVDSDFVHHAVVKGLVNSNDIVPVRYGTDPKNTSFGVVVDPKFAAATMKLYNEIDQSGSEDSPDSAFKIGNTAKTVGYWSQYASVSAVNFGKIKIGRPFIFTAKEKKLAVEQSILRRFDIYWVQFAINPLVDLRGTLEHISFFVSLKTNDSLALDLAPIRFGKDVETKLNIGTPEIKVETPAGGVSIGQIYGQEISYKTLKPTITGTGLQAAEFGWSMTDEMVDMSAKRFVAIIGVPKGVEKIDLEMVLRARPSSRLGSFIQNDIASSAPELFSAALPRP